MLLHLQTGWSSPDVTGHVGLKARGAKTDAHVSVNSVVERMLAAEAEDAASAGEQLPSLESATSPHLPAPPRQKQGQQQLAVCIASVIRPLCQS